jgi:hypothetical protein
MSRIRSESSVHMVYVCLFFNRSKNNAFDLCCHLENLVDGTRMTMRGESEMMEYATYVHHFTHVLLPPRRLTDLQADAKWKTDLKNPALHKEKLTEEIDGNKNHH